jgi:hypothetical protein
MLINPSSVDSSFTVSWGRETINEEVGERDKEEHGQKLSLFG